MKIINKSKYQTIDLKRCIIHLLKKEWKRYYEKSYPRKQAYCEVYSRNVGLGGQASLNGYWMRINIHHWDLTTTEGRKKMAVVLHHEIMHLNGYQHRDMCNKHMGHVERDKELQTWIDKFEIRLKPIKQKKVIDIVDLRYQRALINLKRSSSKLKRAKTIFSKWQTKVRYYEKKAACKEQHGNK